MLSAECLALKFQVSGAHGRRLSVSKRSQSQEVTQPGLLKGAGFHVRVPQPTMSTRRIVATTRDRRRSTGTL